MVREDNDGRYMKMALEEARRSYAEGEVPIGAVLVCKGDVIARGRNLTETLCDPTAHAEMQAVTAGTAQIGGKYLTDCTLYVTVEPCPMCAAALYWAQVGRIVYGAGDNKRGYTAISEKLLHPKTQVTGGVLAEECSALMVSFFKKLRA